MIRKHRLEQGQQGLGLADLAGDAVLFLVSKIVPAVVGFLAVMAYTRLLTGEEYGVYSLVIITVSIVSLVTVGWLAQAALRFFEESNRKGQTTTFVSTITLFLASLICIVCLLWYLAALLLREYVDQNLISLMKIGGLVLALEAAYSVLMGILRADRRTARYALYASLASGGRLGIAILLIHVFSLGASGILWAHVVATGGLCLVGFVWINRTWQVRSTGFSRNLLKQFACYGLPLVLFSVGELILSVSDRYLIGYFLRPHDVGVYAAGYQLATAVVSLFSLPLILAGLPILIQVYEYQGEGVVGRFVGDLVATYFVILVPVVVGFAAVSYEIGRIVLGSAFVSAATIMPWVAIGVFLLGLTLCVNKPFQLKKRTTVMLYPLGLSALINMATNIVLIPIVGILGAAIATVIAYCCYFLFTLLLGRRILTWPFPWRTLANSGLASTAMYVGLAMLPGRSPTVQTIMTKVILGATIYLSVLMMLKERLLYRALDYVNRMSLRGSR